MEYSGNRDEFDQKFDAERRMFADIVKCDLVDTYANLSLKVVNYKYPKLKLQ